MNVNIDDFLADPQSDKRIRLTECRIKMFNGVYTIDDDNKINAVFVPVYPESAARNDKSRVLLKSADRELIATMSDLREFKSQTEFEEYQSQDSKRVYPDKIVEGFIRNRTGLDKAIVQRIKKTEAEYRSRLHLDRGWRLPVLPLGDLSDGHGMRLGVSALPRTEHRYKHKGMTLDWIILSLDETHRNSDREPQRNLH